MSAELLRRAAAKMRETAEAATPGPWSTDPHAYGTDRFVRRASSSPRFCYPAHARVTGTISDHEDEGKLEAKHDSEHIAAWHPVVALAVASWLDKTADHMDPELALDGGCPDCEQDGALVVARAYLGDDA